MKIILVDAINTLILKGEGIFEKMLQLLEEYPNKKIVLTNADDEQIKMFGLDDIPYKLFTLKHKPEKTNPLYYQILLEHLNLNKDEVIYFEHNKDAVNSAKSIGINTYHYDENKKDLAELKKFIDSNI